MPFEITELTIELPLASALKPAKPRDIVPQPLGWPIEPGPFLEEDHVAGAELEPVAQLAPDFGAAMRSAVSGELLRDGCALKFRDCHSTVITVEGFAAV